MADIRILKNTTYDSRGYVDENLLYKNEMLPAATLTKNFTYLYGRGKNLYPLLTNTEGLGAVNKQTPKELNDFRYTWPIMGRMKHTSVNVGLSNPALDTKPGQYKKPIKVLFEDNFLIPTHVVRTPSGKQVRASEEPVQLGEKKWEYTYYLLGGDNTDYVPLTDFVAGKAWAMGGTLIPQSKHDTIRANTMAPGKMTNQFSGWRYSYHITGNVANKITIYEVDAYDGNNQPTKAQMWLPTSIADWADDWKMQNEFRLWEDRYNRDAYGRLLDKDTTNNEPLSMGAGLLQQIELSGNYETYSTLTLKKLDTMLDRIIGSQTDYGFMDIVLYTGMGGRKMFNEAIMNDARGKDYYMRLGELELKEVGDKITYGAYADRYKTIHGNYITIRESAYFDHSIRAEQDKANGNMLNGLPFSSYDLVAVDHSVYDGERNIQFVCEKGNEVYESVHVGHIDLPDMWKRLVAKQSQAATTKNQASYEISGTAGIAMLKNTTSFYMRLA